MLCSVCMFLCLPIIIVERTCKIVTQLSPDPQLQESSYDPTEDEEEAIDGALTDSDVACLLYDTSQPNSFQASRQIFVSVWIIICPSTYVHCSS